MAVDCSELAQNINDMAMNIASRTEVKTLDDVVAKMGKLVPGITRQTVVDSIVEVTESRSKDPDALINKINDIRREALGDKALQNKISELEGYLEAGAIPPTKTRKAKAPPEAIAALREVRDGLKRKIAKSEPAQKMRLQEQIKELNRKLKTGDIYPKAKVVEPKSKDLERLEFERDELRRQIRRRIADLRPKSIWEHIAEPFNVARSLMTSWDLSAVRRQGGFFAITRPGVSAKAFGAMSKALVSEKGMKRIEKEINNNPWMPLAKKAKLFIAPTDGTYKFTDMEEALQSKWAEKIPGIRASERAYITFLNKQRMDAFQTFAETLAKNGDPTLQEAQAIANFVNIATGRGGFGKLEGLAQPASILFFSPRYAASRFQLLLGAPIIQARKTPRIQKLIAKEYGRYLIGMGLYYAMMAFLADALKDKIGKKIQFEWDPRSANFGKIRVGNTRIDPLSGIAQSTVLLSRLVSGKIKSSTTGDIKPIRGKDVPYGGMTATGLLGQFLRFKLSPMFGTLFNIIEGKNAVGEPFGPEDVIPSLTIPLAVHDIKETIEEQGVPVGAALGLMAIFGEGIQTYGYEVKLRKQSTADIKKEIEKFTYKRTTRSRDKETGKIVIRVQGQPHSGKEFKVEALRKELDRRKQKQLEKTKSKTTIPHIPIVSEILNGA